MCWPLTSFGHGCGVMLSATSHGAPRAIKLSLNLIHMVFICLFLFLVRLGRIFLWTLFYACLVLRGGGIVFLSLLIVSLKWPILYHVTRATMLHTLLIFFLRRLFVYMAYQTPLFMIVMLNS